MSNSNLYRTLSQEEMRNINGGIPWKAICPLFGRSAAVAFIDKCISDAIDWVKKRL